LISLIIISVLLFESFFDQIINTLFKNYFFISYHINTSFAVILITSLIISALIKLAEDWFYFNQAQNKLVKDAHQITQSQLTALRAQINPHFLFNALNVIYAMSLEQRTDTKEAVLQLSDILRYIIYDANSNKVTLQQERELINNYIAFQKNRNAEDIQIECTSHIDNSTIEIYPMLLLPLLENAYKHCSVNAEGKHFINISINQQQDIFNFEIENSQAVVNTYNDKELSGVGLKNVQENLKIVYPNKHQFNVHSNDVIYKVNLTIHL
jgi:LytS/YehU family sensor histidine kinase